MSVGEELASYVSDIDRASLVLSLPLSRSDSTLAPPSGSYWSSPTFPYLSPSGVAERAGRPSSMGHARFVAFGSNRHGRSCRASLCGAANDTDRLASGQIQRASGWPKVA